MPWTQRRSVWQLVFTSLPWRMWPARLRVHMWSHFVDWCASLAVPRCPLPTSETTVALYLRSVVMRSKSYAPVKIHSAAIAFYHKVNLFGHLPTRSPAVNMMRQAVAKHFGLGTQNRKDPFRWDQVVSFALVHGGNNRGY
jgi:hypothetical protein